MPVVTAPVLSTAYFETPFTCWSSRLPVKPAAAFTPRPVPLTDHPVVTAPLASTSSCGLVVVDEPPVNHAPVVLIAGVLAAPATEVVIGLPVAIEPKPAAIEPVVRMPVPVMPVVCEYDGATPTPPVISTEPVATSASFDSVVAPDAYSRSPTA